MPMYSYQLFCFNKQELPAPYNKYIHEVTFMSHSLSIAKKAKNVLMPHGCPHGDSNVKMWDSSKIVNHQDA